MSSSSSAPMDPTISSSLSSGSSAAPAIQFDAYGRQGIGVVQPQSGLDYPLVGVPSPDIRYLLADAYLSYDDPADYNRQLDSLVPPFRIVWLYGVGSLPSSRPKGMPAPVHAVDLLVVDANNCVVFDSTVATEFYARRWTERLNIYGWTGDNGTMFIVAHTKWGETADPNMTPVEYLEHIAPDHAVLDERAVERRPKRVKSLRVLSSQFSGSHVQFVEGYNMGIAHEGTFMRGNGLRATQRINFDASPGNGLGVYPGCDPQPLLIRQVNNIRPNAHGDLYMAASECYYVRQPSTIVGTSPPQAILTPATLQFGNDCGPCCACEDYVATANYMNRTRDKYAVVGNQFGGIRDQYHENRERWLASKCCYERFPLRLVVQPQTCPLLDVGGQFCNLTDHCVGGLLLNFHVRTISSTGTGFYTVKFTTGVSGSLRSSSSLASLGSSRSSSSAYSVSDCQDTPLSEEVPGFTHIRGQTYKSPRRSGGQERYEMGGAHPDYTAFWDIVEPSQSVWVRFRLRFGCCGLNAQKDPMYVEICLTGQVGDPVGSPLQPIMVPICKPQPMVRGQTCEPDSSNSGSSSSSGVSRSCWSWSSSASMEEAAVACASALLRCPTDPSDTFDPVCDDGVACAPT